MIFLHLSRPSRACSGPLERRASDGRLKVYYLDECGLTPTLPTAYGWSLPGQHKRIDYESPQGHRAGDMAAYRRHDASPRLEVFTAERTWASHNLLGFPGALPGAKVPRVLVLNNTSLHTSHVVRRARRSLAAAGDYLCFLPPYALELNEIEPVFRQVEYQEIPLRSHTTPASLRAAVDRGFSTYERDLKSKSEKKLRPAALIVRRHDRASRRNAESRRKAPVDKPPTCVASSQPCLVT
jgi:hypothetical protein